MTSKERLTLIINAASGCNLSMNLFNEHYGETINQLMDDLEAADIIKNNAKLSGKYAKECDKDGNLSGIFSVLEVVLTGKDLETIERWLKTGV